MTSGFVTVVSGLPRSGTSMMMKMLEAGGLHALTDNIRAADEDNPKGYYELEKVKELKNDASWIADAEGKVVKVISALLKDLPAGQSYRVLFMRRRMQEILDSQRQMLIRRGQPTDKVPDEKMAAMFENHLVKVDEWLRQQPNMQLLNVNYNEVLEKPVEWVERINAFLGDSLDAAAMTAVVDRQLYRQRR
jgi:hypothetical protein